MITENAYDALAAEAERLRNEVERLRDCLLEINEYWNRAQTEEAMAEALWHIVNVSADALGITEGGEG